jgi:hypothetical protein
VSDKLNREITEDKLLAAHNGARVEESRWRSGQSGCPNGRPKGACNKLSEAFLQALADDFDANGAEVIERVRQERPHDYLKVCALPAAGDLRHRLSFHLVAQLAGLQ